MLGVKQIFPQQILNNLGPQSSPGLPGRHIMTSKNMLLALSALIVVRGVTCNCFQSHMQQVRTVCSRERLPGDCQEACCYPTPPSLSNYCPSQQQCSQTVACHILLHLASSMPGLCHTFECFWGQSSSTLGNHGRHAAAVEAKVGRLDLACCSLLHLQSHGRYAS